MQIFRATTTMQRAATRWLGSRRAVVLVPTMGALHAGHVALIDRARRVAGRRGVVAVSIFVNPLQFGPTEDLSRYPRPLRRDLRICRERGVDAVFLPPEADMYAPNRSVFVDEAQLSVRLCGESRPGHFRGVCTVVAKLFHLVRPTTAIFGMKDYQQLAVIRRMVRDLNFPVIVQGHPTVREADGLALSSRNVYLNAEERAQAPAIARALSAAAALAGAGEREVPAILARAGAVLQKEAPLGRIDYLKAVHADTLETLEALSPGEPACLAAAVFFGRTRLIDNTLLAPARVASSASPVCYLEEL